MEMERSYENSKKYVRLSAIQTALTKHSERHGVNLTLAEATQICLNQGLYQTSLCNFSILPSLYHLDRETFAARFLNLSVEITEASFAIMKNDISYFPDNHVDVFVQGSFHHVLCKDHSHADFEVDYIYQGSYDFFFMNEKRTLKEGDVIFVSPGAVHRIEETSDDAFMVSVYLNFATLSSSFLSTLEHSNFLSDFFKEILSNQSAPNYLFLSIGPRKNIMYLVQDILLEQYKYDEFSPSCTLCWLKLFFSYVMRQYAEFHQFAACGTRMDFGPVLEYISKNYKTASLSEIAAHFNYSTAYLSSIIKKVTGKNYSEIVRKKRLNDACEYLMRTDHTITEIAELCGYNDTDHFSKTFRKVYGKSPSEWRKK